MGKRSAFKRREQDFYPTPREAVERVLPDLEHDLNVFGGFIEPCVGDGALRNHIAELRDVWDCWYTLDIAPRFVGAQEGDATDRETMEYAKRFAGLIITNPPWSFEPLTEMLTLWRELGFTAWVLLSADFAHNVRSGPYMSYCTDIVPVGRLKWMPNSKYASKDNNAWYRFESSGDHTTRFHPRRKE